MKKIIFIILGVVLIGLIIFGIWYFKNHNKTENITGAKLVVQGGSWAGLVPPEEQKEVEKQNKENAEKVVEYSLEEQKEFTIDEDVLDIKIKKIENDRVAVSFPSKGDKWQDKTCFKKSIGNATYSEKDFKNFVLKLNEPFKVSSCTLDAGWEYTLTYKN